MNHTPVNTVPSAKTTRLPHPLWLHISTVAANRDVQYTAPTFGVCDTDIYSECFIPGLSCVVDETHSRETEARNTIATTDNAETDAAYWQKLLHAPAPAYGHRAMAQALKHMHFLQITCSTLRTCVRAGDKSHLLDIDTQAGRCTHRKGSTVRSSE